VVVPVHNGARYLCNCLQALERQSVPRDSYEVIVVWDGDADDHQQLGQWPGVRWLQQAHQGPAAARNLGTASAHGEMVLFTDADCEPAPDWVSLMLTPFGDSRVSGVKGVYATNQQSLVARFAQLEYEDKYRRMVGRETIDFIDTYSAGYRRRILQSAGGFDTRFPTASVEDQELSFRLAKAGHRLVFQQTAVVFHQHPATLWAYVRRKFRIGYWKVLVHRRHPDKLISDSHTPQVLKLQMLLLAMLLPAVGVSMAVARWWLVLGVALALTCSMAPFCVWAWRRDRGVALIAPMLLVTRSLALGLGFATGLIGQSIRGRRVPHVA